MSALPASLPASPLLSEQLKRATRQQHVQAEQGGLMQALIAGRLPLADYCNLLHQLLALYQALERGLDRHAATPMVARLCPAALRRAAPLADDLAHLCAHAGQPAALPLVPATQAYVQRLQQLADEGPLGLLAHAYVRYLGDLYGGQMLGRRLRQQHGLAEGQGTRFYDFGGPAQVQMLIRDFRATLDALPLTPPQAEALVAEACAAFDRHQQIFAELQPLPG